MNNRQSIDVDVTLWYINELCSSVTQSVSFYAIICLYRLIEFSMLGPGLFQNSRKDICRICKCKNKIECTALVSILHECRNSIAHCNDGCRINYKALKSFIVRMGIDLFCEQMQFLLGEYALRINLESLFRALVSVKYEWCREKDCNDGLEDMCNEHRENILAKFEHEMKQALNKVE